MAGLGTVNENNGIYLSVAGGLMWHRKASKDDPKYGTQEYKTQDGKIEVRSGARYPDITGMVVSVAFQDSKFGENINTKVDINGTIYILSIKKTRKEARHIMQALLLSDLSKELFIKSYDFVDKDGKKAYGLSFRQDGEKIKLRVDGEPNKSQDWFKTASKRDIRRHYEDLAEWLEAEVEENVIPNLVSDDTEKPKNKTNTSENEVEETTDTVEEKQEPKEEVKKEVVEQKKVTPLKMKKALKEYIAENYEGEELPKLSKEDLVVWYNLSLEDEELPWPIEGVSDAEVSKSDIDEQLEALMPKQ